MKVSVFSAWSFWALALLFFAYQFVMRLFPGLVMQNFMQLHHIDATSFGLLSSMYYFGYAGMQIPTAILLDRYGPRLVISLSAALCSLATILFVTATQWELALLSRLMIGVGSAAGFLGTSKVISMVFPETHYAKMVGLSFTFGLVGALYGGKPTSLLITHYGWQQVGVLVGSFGFVLALVIALGLRVSPNPLAKQATVLKSIFGVITNTKVLLLATVNLLMVGSLEGFADVWGVSFLVQTFSLLKPDAAFAISFVFIGMLFGGPLLTKVAEFTKIEEKVVMMCGIFTALIFSALLWSSWLFSYNTLCVAMFFVGILCCYQVLIFSIGSSWVSSDYKGITIAFLNCINMFGGSFFHLVIGNLLDWRWQGAMETSEVRLYSAIDYSWALTAIPLASVLGAFGLGLLMKWKK